VNSHPVVRNSANQQKTLLAHCFVISFRFPERKKYIFSRSLFAVFSTCQTFAQRFLLFHLTQNLQFSLENYGSSC